jgi:hypothetical protein
MSKSNLSALRSKKPVLKKPLTLAHRITGLRAMGKFGKKPSRKTYGAGCD